ncbi:S-adenosylmethionine-dependent methyltransferase Rv2258c-like [Branchiostoma floridae x Branchiostoma japonicum]
MVHGPSSRDRHAGNTLNSFQPGTLHGRFDNFTPNKMSTPDHQQPDFMMPPPGSQPSGEESTMEFAMKMFEIVKAGFVCMAMSVGSRAGLFEVMGRLEEPATCQEIADAAGMRVRYVREWVGAMATSGVIDVVDMEKETFFLPRHRIPVLLSQFRRSVTPFCQLADCFAQATGEVVKCFAKDGPTGVPYSTYSTLQDVMYLVRRSHHEDTLVDHFIPTIPGLKEKLESGIHVIDLGCGRGAPSLIMASRFPNSTFYGIDLDPKAMAAATKEAASEDLSNTFFAAHDAAKLPSDWSNKFEYVTAFDAIHDVAFPEEALQEVRRILKPGGLFSLVEIKGNSKISENVGNPFGPVMYSTSLLHCVPVSMHFKGKGLGTIWGKQSVCTMLQESGLRLLGVMDVPEVPEECHYLCQK